MTQVNFLGTAALDDAAGYGTDTDLTAITLGQDFRTAASGMSGVGVRVYPRVDLVNPHVYLFDGAAPPTLLAHKAVSGTLTANSWHDVVFDTPVALGNGGQYIGAIYMPGGGYAHKAHVYDVELPAPTDSGNLFARSGSAGQGNNVFYVGTLSDPTNPVEITAHAGSPWSTFNATGYGVDVIVEDPSLGGTAPSNSVAPALSGTAQIGANVTTSNGTWSGTTPITYGYQWQKSTDSGTTWTNIAGSTAATYTPVTGDVGSQIRCVVTATNTIGSASANSNALTVSAPPAGAPVNTVLPALTGSALVGSPVQCDTGSWNNTPTTFDFQFQTNASGSWVDIAGASASGRPPGSTLSYSPVAGDVGHAIRCVVTAHNSSGSTAVNSASETVAAVPTGSARINVLIDGEWVTLNIGGGGISVLSEAGIRPEDYGDTTGDATDAFKACFDDAVSRAVANGSYYSEIVLDPTKRYVLSGALTQGGTTKGNAQVPLPIVATTDPKVTLVLKGGEFPGGWAHWQATTPQEGGAVIESTLTGLTNGGFGPPSIIGGPTAEQGYGKATNVFNNMLFVVKGVQFIAPDNPSIMGLDLGGLAQARILSMVALSKSTPAAMGACTHDWAAGLRLPEVGNNDQCTIDDFGCQGFYYGLIASEHLAAERVGVVKCVVGVALGDPNHSMWMGYVSAEACETSLQIFDEANEHTAVFIAMMDVEDDTGSAFPVTAHVDDSGNRAQGFVGYHNNALDGTGHQGIPPVVLGANNLKVVNLHHDIGAVTEPSVPASASALKNPFWRDAVVYVSGGTVSAIAVDGETLGVTSGPIDVPSGKSVTLTYTAAPTWKWILR